MEEVRGLQIPAGRAILYRCRLATLKPKAKALSKPGAIPEQAAADVRGAVMGELFSRLAGQFCGAALSGLVLLQKFVEFGLAGFDLSFQLLCERLIARSLSLCGFDLGFRLRLRLSSGFQSFLRFF